jgi:choline dehydrogenase-like flavoprotein
MFMEAHDLADRNAVQADLCVVGAGAAGIAIALQFADTPLRVVVLESGGLVAERRGRAIYQVVADFKRRLSVDHSRMAYFGGNTNHWQGNCRPLDEGDFEPLDWIRYSGWPIRRHDLLPYYERAQAVCGLGNFRGYDLDVCRPHLNHQPLDVEPATLTNKVVHACPVLSFAELHGQRLAAARNVRILLHANGLRLKANAGRDQVSAVEIIGADGRRTHIEASAFVLAAGGVENARLLLCSSEVSRNGLANDHDLVGRFFMEHWYLDIGLDSWGEARDLDFYCTQPVGGARVWGQLVLADEVRRHQRAAGLSLWFVRTPLAAPGLDSARRITAFLRGRARLAQPLTDIQLVLSDPGMVVGRALGKLRRRGRPGTPRGEYALRVQLEQTPDPENRIRLSSERDRFGQPRAELVLRLTDEDRRGHGGALRIAADALGMNGRRLARQMHLMLGAGRHGFFWHHMGSTRMHADPAQGVVDRNCRVHGVSNLFIAGSSVFPTGGTAAPTLTIVALALRLADHIRQHPGMPTASR